MDDVRIYNRALDASEVAALYTFGKVRMNSRPHAGAAFTNGLVGHWTLDGADTINNIVDQSGQGNTGLLSHGGSGTTTSPGVLGQALKFDGVDDYVKIADQTIFDTAPITVAAWFKSNVANSSVDLPIVSKGRAAVCGFDGWSLYRDDATETFRFCVNGTTGNNTIASTAAFVDTKWHHVLGVYDGNTISIYVDGSLANTPSSYSDTMVNTARSVCLGLAAGNDNNCLSPVTFTNGFLDDVRIYNRALSAQEVRQLYNMGR